MKAEMLCLRSADRESVLRSKQCRRVRGCDDGCYNCMKTGEGNSKLNARDSTCSVDLYR